MGLDDITLDSAKIKIRKLFREASEFHSVLILELLNSIGQLPHYAFSGYECVMIAECYRLIGDHATSLSYFRIALRTCPKGRLDSVYARVGNSFFELGRIGAAERWLHRSIKASNSSKTWRAYAYFVLARSAVRQLKLGDAERAIRKSLTLNDEQPESWILACNILVACRKLRHARKYANMAVRKFPGSTPICELRDALNAAILLRDDLAQGIDIKDAITTALLQ